ncbi:MAG TPA: TOBE domain-containing protein [Xanthobacteraceae bacterium]
MALGATAGALLLGVPAAFAVSRHEFPGRATAAAALLSPLVFPALITGVALLQLFATIRSNNTPLNMLIAHVLVTAPYVVRTVTASLTLADITLEDAARTPGAGRMQTELRGLQQRLGVTTVFVTHDQDEALTMADRIVIMRDGWVEQIGTPAEVYRRPISRFVADFLGAANFFRGRVERVVDGASLVVVPDGPTLTVPSSRAIGSQVTVALRPESIALASPAAANGDPAPNTTPAIVEQVIYHGFVTHLYLRMPNGAPLIAFRQNRAETSDAPSAPGTWLHASWPGESGHIVRDEAAEPAAA